MKRQRNIQKSLPLAEYHRKLGGRFEQYGEWLLPAEYRAGAVEEHRAVRLRAGLFDLSHLGKILIRGYRSGMFLSYFLSGAVSGMRDMSARFHLICTPAGRILDGVMLYRLSDSWFLTSSPESADEIQYWFEENLERYAAEVEQVTGALAMFSLQGPASMEIIARAAGDAAAALPVRGISVCDIAGVRCKIGRTGLTGGDGFELFIPSDHAAAIWETLLSPQVSSGTGLLPAGFRARESLRLESGLPGFGTRRFSGLTPVEAGFMRHFDFSKPFLVKDLLLKQVSRSVKRRTLRLRLNGRKAPVTGTVLCDPNQRRVGTIIAAAFIPISNEVIAEAVLDSGIVPVPAGEYQVRIGF